MKKYIQSEITFSLKTVMSPPPPPPIPPKPHDMTNEELEKWYLVEPSKAISREVMARINDGVKFSHIRVVQYLGLEPVLRIRFHD